MENALLILLWLLDDLCGVKKRPTSEAVRVDSRDIRSRYFRVVRVSSLISVVESYQESGHSNATFEKQKSRAHRKQQNKDTRTTPK